MGGNWLIFNSCLVLTKSDTVLQNFFPLFNIFSIRLKELNKTSLAKEISSISQL